MNFSSDVINNIAFARANMKMNIYDQAVLEGVATSFPQTEEIMSTGKISGVTATDVQKPRCAASADRICEVLDTESSIKHTAAPKEPAGLKGSLTFRDVESYLPGAEGARGEPREL